MVTLSSPQLREPCIFMIDSGSGVNLIKQSSLNSEVPWEDRRTYTLQGISSLSLETFGSVLVSLVGKPTTFHVVPDSAGFVQNGILGNRFLQDHEANVNYKDKCLHYDNIKIPFTEIANIRILGRSVSPFYVNVTNPEKQYGYIPLVMPTKGLYYGNAVVTNVNGRAYLPIINTNEINYKLEIPSIALEDFDLISSSAETRGHTAANSCDLRDIFNEDFVINDEKNDFENVVLSGTETRGHTVADSCVENFDIEEGQTNRVNSRDNFENLFNDTDGASSYNLCNDNEAISIDTGDFCKNLESRGAAACSQRVIGRRGASVVYDKEVIPIDTGDKSRGAAEIRHAYGRSDASSCVPVVLKGMPSIYFCDNETREQPTVCNDNCNVNDSVDDKVTPTRKYKRVRFTLPDDDEPANEFCHRVVQNISNPVYVMDRNDPPDKMRHKAAVVHLLRLDHLNLEEKDNIISLVTRHLDRFQLPDEKLDATNAVQHFIPTVNEVPIHTKQYRYPPVHKEEIDKQVGKLLSDGLIECSSSPYSSPVWIVPKKADSSGQKRWRMVIDYRNLNEKTIGDAYPLPNISDILDQLGNAKYFSILDLASGFHQIPMAPKDAPKTAFSTPYGHYQFKRMPFGLKNAPATFQRLMDNVLSGLQGNELFVYMDDIVIYARSIKEHEVKFERLMKRLKEANLKLQPDKCEFLRQEVAYLGHIICADGVRPDPDKIKSIMRFPRPKNPKNIKQFLGLSGYYRRFIPNFSKIAKPLTDLLKKDRMFTWLPKHEEAFDILKLSLCSEPVLQYPDFSRSFNLTTDASGHAVGGVLSQGNVGKDLPIAYTSRILNKAEQNYSTIEKECLAIVYCTNHFRPYLYGRKFIIITDHKPLVWLHSVKDPSSRLWKWRNKLAEYDYEIRYKVGLSNRNADALSRNPPVDATFPLRTLDEIDYSSDDSLFSAADPRSKNRKSDSPKPINLLETNKETQDMTRTTDHHGERSESPAPNVMIEEYDEDDDDDDEMDDVDIGNQTLETLDESNNTYEEIFDSNRVPYQEKAPEQPKLKKFFITESRDSLINHVDNHVIFIHMNGMPFDSGAFEYRKNNLLPKYENLTFERAHVTTIRKKNVLISLPIKFSSRVQVEAQTLDSCLQSLVDVINELGLTSFCINKTNNFDDLTWHFIIGRIYAHLQDIMIRVTICKNLLQTPTPGEREALILENHSSAYGGHKGVTKTYNRLRTHYYWNTMKRDIQNFIRKCRQCQLRKLTRVKTKQPMIITDTPGAAFDKISMDIMGPLPITNDGSRYVLTIQDLLTKYSVAAPLKEASSLSIADAFVKKFICTYGAPKIVLTDQGANFLSSLIRNLTRKFNIQHLKTTAYHPQSNGSIERSHHVLMEYLRTQVDKEDNWNEYIELAIFSYNTNVHEGTKYSPFELVFGRIARLPSAHTPIEENLEITYYDYLTNLFNKLYDIQTDARRNLIQSKERSKYYYDRMLNVKTFDVGTYVFLLKEPQKGKFAIQYTGPHQIIELLPNNNVKILIDNRPRIVHADKLKIAHIDPG